MILGALMTIRAAFAYDSATNHDILKPGGLFAIVNWYNRPREQTTVLGVPRGPATELRMTPDQTIASVEPGGLQFRNRVEVSPYHYGVVFERQQ